MQARLSTVLVVVVVVVVIVVGMVVVLVVVVVVVVLLCCHCCCCCCSACCCRLLLQAVLPSFALLGASGSLPFLAVASCAQAQACTSQAGWGEGLSSEASRFAPQGQSGQEEFARRSCLSEVKLEEAYEEATSQLASELS